MPKYHVILRQESETIADIEADSEDEAIIRLLIEPNKDFDYKKEEPSQVKPVTTSKIYLEHICELDEEGNPT